MTDLIVPKGKSILDCAPEVIERFRKDFLDPTLGIGELAKKYERASSTIYNWGNIDLGLHRPKLKVDNRTTYRDLLASISKMVSAMPEVKIPYAQYPTRESGCSIALKLSDIHSGRKTESYSSEVFKHRLGILGDEVDALAQLLAYEYTINALNIFALGDWVLGERLGYQVNVEEVESFIMSQIFELLVPYISRWLIDRLETFPEICFYGVPGNHGELGRFQSKSANWDTFVYKVIEQRLSEQSRIEFNIALHDWKTFACVEDTSFLLVHGDQFSVSGGQPQKGIASKVLRWNSTLPTPFDYVVFAHFHSVMKFLAGSIPCYGNGAFLSDDEWVREELGLEGSCSQTALVVSGKEIILEKEIRLNE